MPIFTISEIPKDGYDGPVVEERMRIAATKVILLTVSAVCPLLAGCISDHAWTRRSSVAPGSLTDSSPSASSAMDLHFGQPNKLVDSAGWIVGIPRKVLLWDRRVDNHDVGDETTETMASFARLHELEGVCIRVNQYDPLGEFSRLRTNQSVAPGWRYTFGTMRLISYTLAPGRVFGGDQYNPYTNSVYIYSDVPALAVEAAAYAKDVQSRSLPGTYAAVNELPFVSIWHETVNVRDAAAFMKTHGTDQQRTDGLRVLHANYGSTLAVATGAGPVAQVGAAVAGQLTGRFHASRHTAAASKSAMDGSGKPDGFPVKLASASQPED
ncbi:MAG: hypothetical protein KDB01_24220 [Planctomycetaceae bacterium]|nr:hypothetical protein [Planctomycetaceae bacterium]